MDTRAITLSTARDIVTFYTKPLSYKPSTMHSQTMVRLLRELLSRHPGLFESMISVCKPEHFESVAQHMFQNNIENFGRLVTLYTYVGLLAKRCGTEEWLTYDHSTFVLKPYVHPVA